MRRASAFARPYSRADARSSGLVVTERVTEQTRSKVSGDASGFKTTFMDVARLALRECLQKMKMLPAR